MNTEQSERSRSPANTNRAVYQGNRTPPRLPNPGSSRDRLPQSLAPASNRHPDNSLADLSLLKAQHERANQIPAQPKNTLITVECPDYFVQNSQLKILHFFQPRSTFFHWLDIESLTPSSRNVPSWLTQVKMRVANLRLDFVIPRQHRSVITSKGEIFLTGGIHTQPPGSSAPERPFILKKAYRLDVEQTTLTEIPSMLIGRAEHSLIELNGELYALGGITTEQNRCTTACEKYSPQRNAWTQLPSLKSAVFNASVCVSKSRYIYLLGGKSSPQTLSDRVDRLDTGSNRWEEIFLDVSTVPPSQKAFFRLLSLSAAVAVAPDAILVFGGTYEEYTTKSAGSFVLKVKKSLFPDSAERHEVCAVNQHLLPAADAFWSQQAIVHQGLVFALQNVPSDLDDTKVQLDARRVLMFDSNGFISIS